MTDVWLPVAEAASALGCSVRTVDRRIAAGRLDARLSDDGRREVLVAGDDRPDVPAGDDGRASVAAVAAVADQADRQVALALGSATALTRAAQDDAARCRRGSCLAWSMVGVMAAGVVVAVGWTTRAVTLSEVKIDAQAHQLDERAAVTDTLADKCDALRRDLDAARVAAAGADARLAVLVQQQHDAATPLPTTRPTLTDALAAVLGGR